jgi:CDP-diacylglycerol--glycerol-3-phosphate 3-phosphatidyltransferase
MGESGVGHPGLTAAHEAGWSGLHHGIDPARVPFLRAWLRLMHTIARRLWFVPPSLISVLGVLFAIDALLLASSSPWFAFALVLLAALCDGLDGAVAVIADRATRAGAFVDKLADRIVDTAFALVIWRCGAPWWLAVCAALLSLLHEAIRELGGGTRRVRITVAERPTRVICAAVACVSAAVSSASWPPTVCAAVWVGLALIGLVQVATP